MAGHSKRHNIRHRKAAQDAKKSKIYATIAKNIQMAAKGGDDPSLNPALEASLVKAKQAGLPKEVIQKAIDKGAGNDTGEELFEIFYEGYGPGGVALYIKCVTSNTNRSGACVRAILTKYGGNMGEPGSVGRQFQEKGEIFVTGKLIAEKSKGKIVETVYPLEEDDFEMNIIETDAEHYEFSQGEDGTVARVVTSRDSLISTLKQLEASSRKIESSDFAYLADNEIALDERNETKLQTILEQLEDDEDVDTVWHNAA